MIIKLLGDNDRHPSRGCDSRPEDQLDVRGSAEAQGAQRPHSCRQVEQRTRQGTQVQPGQGWLQKVCVQCSFKLSLLHLTTSQGQLAEEEQPEAAQEALVDELSRSARWPASHICLSADHANVGLKNKESNFNLSLSQCYGIIQLGIHLLGIGFLRKECSSRMREARILAT